MHSVVVPAFAISSFHSCRDESWCCCQHCWCWCTTQVHIQSYIAKRLISRTSLNPICVTYSSSGDCGHIYWYVRIHFEYTVRYTYLKNLHSMLSQSMHFSPAYLIKYLNSKYTVHTYKIHYVGCCWLLFATTKKKHCAAENTFSANLFVTDNSTHSTLFCSLPSSYPSKIWGFHLLYVLAGIHFHNFIKLSNMK